MIIDISTKIGTTSNQGGFKGLLDVYSGAAAAYSLRKLSKATTSVVRVRRDSDNAEADFTALEITDGTLEAWVGAGNDGLVTTWYDQSGNGNDATQGSASAQPKIVDAGVLVRENGKAAVDFDGVDDNLTATFAEITQPTTHILVATFNVLDENKIIIDGNNNNATRQIPVFNRNTGNTDMFAGTLVPFATNDNNQNSYFIKFNDALSEASKNGINTTGLSAGTNSLQNLTVGANLAKDAFATTILQEIVIYPSDQSTNRIGIESRINNYYNIY